MHGWQDSPSPLLYLQLSSTPAKRKTSIPADWSPQMDSLYTGQGAERLCTLPQGFKREGERERERAKQLPPSMINVKFNFVLVLLKTFDFSYTRFFLPSHRCRRRRRRRRCLPFFLHPLLYFVFVFFLCRPIRSRLFVWKGVWRPEHARDRFTSIKGTLHIHFFLCSSSKESLINVTWERRNVVSWVRAHTYTYNGYVQT